MSIDRRNDIASFIEYSKCSTEAATYWLERCNWDLDAAKHRYWLEVILIADMDED